MLQVVKDLQGGLNFPPAPTQRLPVVVRGEAGPTLALMRWGLVPSWGPQVINARAETEARLPRRLQEEAVPGARRREWKVEGGKKQPYRFTMADGGLFMMAGLWERWRHRRRGAGSVRSTTEILPPEVWEAWLDPASPDPKALLAPFPAEAMRAYRVGTRLPGTTIWIFWLPFDVRVAPPATCLHTQGRTACLSS